MNDYERIARVLRFLEKSRAAQSGLATLAKQAGLSPFHFHRLFSRWAGVTPEDFLRCLTLSDAKARLKRGESVLDAALGAGLSGPGRLHDLCVRLEAATPGEITSGGAGWTIAAGFAETPFGTCLVAEGPRGIAQLSFPPSTKWANATVAIREDWPRAKLRREDAVARKWAARLFGKAKKNPGRKPLHAVVRGSTFQVRVWRALLRVPAGSLVSYGRLARAAGCPGAARAVGTAVGQNRLAWLVPCHRVIRETGALGNYRWGPVRKRAMLAWEGAATRRGGGSGGRGRPRRGARRASAFARRRGWRSSGTGRSSG